MNRGKVTGSTEYTPCPGAIIHVNPILPTPLLDQVNQWVQIWAFPVEAIVGLHFDPDFKHFQGVGYVIRGEKVHKLLEASSPD